MKKLLTNLALIFAVCSVLTAQADYRKGYIVKLNGDTLSGYINFQKEAINNTICSFKRFEIAISVSYSPEKIRAYGFSGGKQFMAANVNGKYYFIEYLVKGDLSLLYLNRGGKHFFTYDQDKVIVELSSGKISHPITKVEYSGYKEFLKEKLKDVDFQTSVQESNLEINSLTNLIKIYNNQSGMAFEIPQRPKEKNTLSDYNILGTNKLHFGILGGTSICKFAPVIKETSYFFLTNADFKWNSNFIGGIFLRWNFSKVRPNLSLQTNFMYQKVSLYGFSKHEKPMNRDIILFDDVYIDFSEIKMQSVLNFSLLESKWRIVPHVGVGYNKRIKPTYRRFYEEYNTISSVVKSYEFFDFTISSGDPVLLGGVSFENKLSSARSLFVNLNFEYGSKIIEDPKDSFLQKLKLKGKAYTVNVTLGITL
jgi:hypothetical protein